MSASTARKIRPVEKVTGIGGVFFRARDPEALAAWYHDHLGIDTEEGKPWEQQGGLTVFAPFDEATDYFGRREQQWMLKSCEPRSTTSTPRWRRWRWTGERRGRRSAISTGAVRPRARLRGFVDGRVEVLADDPFEGRQIGNHVGAAERLHPVDGVVAGGDGELPIDESIRPPVVLSGR